ncbi:MAG: glutamate formimidoyltransferase [Anaerolineae bacterium]|nr:glutamate formimidoyltransferase [Anaerolineae bacterium]MDW8173576.1 glutamate formimidoyltransferase [Anaerolineae bacterium]
MNDLPLIECIANVSEGRNSQVIATIVQAIESVPGVAVLHQTSDHDHHRSVITFVGRGPAVAEAAFRLVAEAARLIDLDQHYGAHPRVGACDVLPFVPLGSATLAECVALAEQVGARIGAELGLPVYLYEAAARRPERRNLADVRRGGYEALKASIHTSERKPDFGPSVVGKAGAVIVGARQPLIAYNVFLTTNDVKIAQAIAKAVRASSGGLAGVKALGLLVDGRAQVSMNLVDHQRTPLHRVMELIRRECQRYGVAVLKSELIGLIPQQALYDAAAWYLQLDDFGPERVLEQRLMQYVNVLE